MTVDKWDKYRAMTDEELKAAVESGDGEAAAYIYIEKDDADFDPLGDDIMRNNLRDEGYSDEEIEEIMDGE